MKKFALVISVLVLVSLAVAVTNDVCSLKHSQDGVDGAICLGYFPSWSYKGDTNECVKFIYGGCGGNDNRFNSPDECEDTCKK